MSSQERKNDRDESTLLPCHDRQRKPEAPAKRGDSVTRTPTEFIGHLLEVGTWYHGAIELPPYDPRVDGEDLAREAKELVARGGPRCETCRYWTEERTCWRLASIGSKAKTTGDFPGEAELVTEPDFGCIQWEGS